MNLTASLIPFLLFFLFPFLGSSQIEQIAIERFYEYGVETFADPEDFRLEESGIIFGKDTLQIQIRNHKNAIAPINKVFVLADVTILINKQSIEKLSTDASGEGLDEMDAMRNLIENWLTEFGSCLAQYIAAPEMAMEWNNYLVYVNRQGTGAKHYLGFIDGSQQMHIDIFQSLEKEIEQHFTDQYLSLIVSVTNRTKGTAKSYIQDQEKLKVSGSINGQEGPEISSRLKTLRWPLDQSYRFKRSYLFVKKE